MRRRLTCLILAVPLLAGLSPSAVAAPTSMPRATYVLVRTASLSAPSSWSLGTSISSEGFIGVMGVRIERGRAVSGENSVFSTFGTNGSPEASAFGEHISLCGDLGRCEGDQVALAGTHGQTYQDSGGSSVNNRFYIAIEGKRPYVGFSGRGWVIRKAPFAFRWLDSNQTDAPQARGGGFGVEVFLSGSLTGGAYGSAASITLPCSGQGESTVRQGVGRLTLSAPGVEDQSALCAVFPGRVTSVSAARTTWTVHGVAAGQNGLGTARLFVVDLPRSP